MNVRLVFTKACPNGMTNITASSGSLKYPESGTYGKNETKCWSITVPDTYAGILFRFFRYVFHFLRLSITCQLWGSELKLWLHFMLPLIIFLTNIVTAEKKPPEKWPFFNSSEREHLIPGLQNMIGGGEKQFLIICV